MFNLNTNKMKHMKILTLFLSMTFFLQVFAQDARYTYGPVTGINLDDMLAIAAKTYQDNGVKTDKFNYSQGVIVSTSYKFTVLVSEYRADIEVKNTDNGAYISFIDMQMKGSNGLWQDVATVLGKKPDKLIKSIGQNFENISKDPNEIEAAKKDFYNAPYTHYLFFKKATELAADRWYENFMKDKTFNWQLKFSDIKKNESKKFEGYKYVVTARYYPGSSLTGLGGLYVKLYTNSDDLAMAEKNSKVKIEGKCVGFKEYMGYYYIDFEQ
jgi:hypothetical protein